MIIIVTGGRDFTDRGFVNSCLDKIKPTLIIEGGARGADRLCRDYAISNGIKYKTYEADWDTYGKRAGHVRNRNMIVRNPDATLVAFPGGRGTENCIEQAREAGMIVLKQVPPDPQKIWDFFEQLVKGEMNEANGKGHETN